MTIVRQSLIYTKSMINLCKKKMLQSELNKMKSIGNLELNENFLSKSHQLRK